MHLQCRYICSLFLALTFGIFALASTSDLAQARETEKRIALIIGIADYSAVSKLKNTINDTTLIGETLEKLQFEVTKLIDPNLNEMRAAISKFSFEAETSDVALVYYAGHGVEFGGENMLLPVDVSAESRSEIAAQSISLSEILRSVDKARQLRLVILDSCRDDPFRLSDNNSVVILETENDRSTATRQGLGKPSPERGTLVAFAAEAGNVALDGAGENSPFAKALSQNLATEDLEIGLMFRRVRDDVLRKTNNNQEPHTYGSLSGNPYFLAGSNRELNIVADKEGRRNAWEVLKPDQEKQLAALAENGDARALKGLAYMRLNPEGKRYDPQQATRLLLEAAQTGDPEAQFELARLYEKGIGVEQDVEKAISYYWKSADQDFPDAINDLGFLHFQGGLGIVRDSMKAIGLFQRAADLRHPEAMFNIAALIDDGLVPDKKAADSAAYLYESLRSGNPDVLDQLSKNPKMFKRETRRELQRLLFDRQLYDGALDANFGPQTKRSLRKAYGITE